MKYINCEKYATEILDEVKQVKHTKYFAIVSVGDNPASQSYIKGKIKDCEYCGIPYMHIHIDVKDDTEAKCKLEEKLYGLRMDDKVSAITAMPTSTVGTGITVGTNDKVTVLTDSTTLSVTKGT